MERGWQVWGVAGTPARLKSCVPGWLSEWNQRKAVVRQGVLWFERQVTDAVFILLLDTITEPFWEISAQSSRLGGKPAVSAFRGHLVPPLGHVQWQPPSSTATQGLVIHLSIPSDLWGAHKHAGDRPTKNESTFKKKMNQKTHEKSRCHSEVVIP